MDNLLKSLRHILIVIVGLPWWKDGDARESWEIRPRAGGVDAGDIDFAARVVIGPRAQLAA
jgi:hypothetical protein